MQAHYNKGLAYQEEGLLTLALNRYHNQSMYHVLSRNVVSPPPHVFYKLMTRRSKLTWGYQYLYIDVP